MSRAIDVVEALTLPATWFVTHDTPLLDRLRQNPSFELGIHPDFNPLLFGGTEPGRDAGRILRDLLTIVPEARSVRSHSMTQSSRLLDLFQQLGLKFDCNHFIPYHAQISLRPWVHWNGMVRVPYCWEDDIFVLEGAHDRPGVLLAQPGLKVVDFHPIHIALNSNTLAAYEESRPVHHSWEKLKKYQSAGYGVRRFLEELANQVAQ